MESDQTYHLDIQGAQPYLFKLYTQLTLGFKDAAPTADTIAKLRQALDTLINHLPWLRGQVVASSANESSRYKIIPLENAYERFVVKDLTGDSSQPTWAGMELKSFPASLVNEELLSPLKTLSAGSDGVAPVLVVQATFITGGLLLTFVAQHNVMDMTGQGQIINLFAKLLRGESLNREELETANIERREICKSIIDEARVTAKVAEANKVEDEKAGHEAESTKGESTEEASPEPVCRWDYYVFSGESLQELKNEASKCLEAGFISTDDALTALVWRAVTRARRQRVPDDSATTIMARAINPRKLLGISDLYAGVVQNMAYTPSTLKEVTNEPLGKLAAKLRSSLCAEKLTELTKQLITSLATDSKIDESVAAQLDLRRDLMLSSWSKEKCYEFEFGHLGRPSVARRPSFPFGESLIYFMPRRPDGEVAVMLGLRSDDLENLKNDTEFLRYGRFIG